MVINIPFPPDDVARLQAWADKVGKSVAQVVADAVAHEVSGIEPGPAPSPAERLRHFEDFIARLPKQSGVLTDDSRESIYGDDGR